MTRYQFVVLTQALPGREAEFEAWYDNQHIPDVARVPGVVSARRFHVETVMSNAATPPLPWVSLALYEIESDDPHAVLAEIKARSNTPDMPLSEAIEATGTLQVLASPIPDA